MTTVAVTGAAGEVGRVVVEAFDDGARTLFTHREHDDLDSDTLDVTDLDAFVDAVGDEDVLVHLAWVPGSKEEWDEDHERNVRGVYNAFEAARENGLDRVVFASSNHVTGMYNRDDPAGEETMAENPTTAVDPTTPVRPDGYYGVAKVACESMGSYYADRFDVEVVNLRIGWLMTEAELREKQDESLGRTRFARAMWLSHRDCRQLVGAAAREPLATSPLTVNAVSRNDDRYLTLTEATLHLDYRPQDNAAAVLEDA